MVNYKCNMNYWKQKKWNGKEYDINGNDIYEIKKGNGFIKNMILMEIYYLKENI